MANSNNNQKIVEIKNLNVTFHDIKLNLQALKDINLVVNEDEFVSIIGPSGCGKSTLFHILGDILVDTNVDINGKVKILNQKPNFAREKRQVGVVFQKPTLLEWRNVIDNVTLPLEIIGQKKHTRIKKAEKLLDLVGLLEYRNFRPSQLSGGMQQRVSIARALAYDPELLLMDEPFGALDEITRRNMNDQLIKIWKKTKKTILFVTHSIEEAVYLSEKIIVLSKRPGTVEKTINIKIPYPRQKYQNKVEFFEYIKQVRQALHQND